MTELLVLLALVAVVVVAVRLARTRREVGQAKAREVEMGPVTTLAFEDVTALGTELQALDAEVAGLTLDEATRADYQRALDAYDDAKASADAMTGPDDITHVTHILDDGRYAIACVRARVAGDPLPTRRPACFFDPRHGISTTDIMFTPAGGAPRQVPVCTMDADRVRVGAEPHIRTVMQGPRRVAYWDAGPAYAPYAAGYFGAGAGMAALFGGLLIGGAALGLGAAFGEAMGDGVADVADGGFLDGGFDFDGFDFDGFDF